MPTIYDAVDAILQAVEDATPGAPGIPTRDRNDVILLSAYGRAYRCLRTIRRVAAEGEADDAAALTRVLLSTALRSLYITQPAEHDERQRRLAQLVHSSRRDHAAMLDEMQRLGFPNITDQDVADARALADETKWAGRLPSDQDLASDSPRNHGDRDASAEEGVDVCEALEGRDVLDECKTVSRRIVGSTEAEREAFIEAFKNSRNYYTHYNPKLEKKAARGAALLVLAVQLQAIIEMSMLRELGFTARSIDEILSRVRRYEEIAHFKRVAAEEQN